MLQNRGSSPNTAPFPEVQPPNPAVASKVKEPDEETNKLLKIEFV
jgi:hypothetical protein